MIPKRKELVLIKIYMYICDIYDIELKYYCQRYSNNSKPVFTDQEILTIYLFAGHCQQYFRIKDIHGFAKEYLHSWFPRLPSYQTFNYRLNRLSAAFKIINERLIQLFRPSACDKDMSFVDSLPIITCSTSRHSKVAREITGKGYCSTKNLYYYGLKLHVLAFRRAGTIPFPESLVITAAEEHDLSTFKYAWGDHISKRSIFGDKIYTERNRRQHIRMFTPVKGVRGQSTILRQMDKAYNDLFSSDVSSVRQPVESFFNWLIEKTDIQKASKVRSTQGLLVHMMGKIAIAFIYLIF